VFKTLSKLLYVNYFLIWIKTNFFHNIGHRTVYEAELTGLMLPTEYAAQHNWYKLWLESDSSSVVHALKKIGLMVICSNIYMEGNCCADTMATLGPDVTATTWFHTMPASLSVNFARDRHGPPNFRFP